MDIVKNFILRAQQIHGNKYDYSKVKYVNVKTKISIICFIHGEFRQRPNNHLTGNGCPLCGIDKRKLNVNEFIAKSNEIHKNKYDYSKVRYVNSATKVLIICPEHGGFVQTPNVHLGGHGCIECGYDAITSDNENFIKKSIVIHHNKYDYSKVIYVNGYMPIHIICPIHGVFLQCPQNHLKGAGCEKCQRENQKYTTHEFIYGAMEIHGNKYDYSKTNYYGINSKILITCRKHGDFLQTPNNHLQGHGCQKCKSIALKDGTFWASMVEAWYYLKNIKDYGIDFKYNGRYGLGRRRYDFYFPQENKYVEITGFSEKNPIWNNYLSNIKEKRVYVENILGAKFEFIHKFLTIDEIKYVNNNVNCGSL